MMSKDRPLTGYLLLFFLLVLIQGCSGYSNPQADIIYVFTYKIIDSFPHDKNAFTQGLVWKDGFLYEGTGLYGRSSVRKVELETGKILQKKDLPDDLFGEGITIFNDKIYQLTWKAETGFIYDLSTFELLETFSYGHEGWGITHNEEYLIISDGTSILHFLEPSTLEEVKQVKVYENQNPISRINELEYIKGKIYANIWQTDRIAIIEPESGKISGWLDLNGILTQEDINQKIDVLNGIAFDQEDNRLFITGKLWPKIFQIEIID